MNEMLYIEDDEILANVTVRALARRGYSIRHYSCLADARVAENFQRFSHALLDLKLDDGVSLPLIAELVEANPDMRILVLTGYASVATAVQAVKMGATNYLAKPATADQIIQAFDEYHQAAPAPTESAADIPEKMSLKRLEWEHIQQVLTENNGNIALTARQLKMHRRTLQRKLKKKPVAE